jgi:hypothetical protein
MRHDVSKYLADIGRRGGKKSRRRLDSGTARNMVKVREARRAFQEYHSSCFWFYDPNYRITLEDVPWVAKRLMEHGGRHGWQLGAKLCR